MKTTIHFKSKQLTTVRANLFFLLAFSFLIFPAQAQWYTGMSQKTGLALCIHLTDTAAKLYSPMQTTDPIPVSSWSLTGDKLTLECKTISLKMNLTRHQDSWQGNWKQGLFKEDITFLPTDSLFTLRRPQTPQPPYRFDEDTVAVDYVDSQGNQVHLEGTLSYPKGGGRYPCLVLASGSGQQNRDEELFQHKPFLVLADYLASRGIAVLRYDDRGVGASTGSAEQGTTALFSEDAEAMLRALKGNPHVDPARLGIGGHSEGGAIAPLVAVRNKDVKFVVMLAGQGCTGLDVLMQQNEAIYRAAGLGDSLLALRQSCMRELFTMPAGSSQKDYKAVIDRHTAGLTKEQVDSIGMGRGAAATMKQQMDWPWIQAFLTLDPADYLPQVTCPVLALGGSKDLQVLAHPNLDRIKQLCPQADCCEMPDLNHLFQHCKTGSPDEYILIEETFSTDAMKALADWIQKL